MTDSEKAKRAVGEAAAQLVKNGMMLGLGTGSTTAFAIKAIGQRVADESLSVQGIPTSFQAERLAREAGIPITTFAEVERLDLALDGADEVDDELNLIKGGGGAHSREKVVAAEADHFVVLVDPSKHVERLGEKMPVPLEVMPMAEPVVKRTLRSWGIQATLREAERKSGPVVTDQGFWILDATCINVEHIEQIASKANLLPGVLDHGLFLGMADEVLVGMPDGSVSRGLPE